MNSTSTSPLADSTADRKSLLMAATWTWTSVAIMFVAMRFYCRIRLVRSVWWDDYMILASVCSTIAMSIVWTIYANYGGCRHAASLTMTQLIDTARLNWVSQPLCIAGLTTGKISVACLIARLQAPTKWRRYLLWGLCSLMVCINITVATLMFTQCTPITLLWNPDSAPHGHCLNPNVVSIMSQSASSYMAFVDLVLAAIPVHMIWNLQMDKSKKIGICVLLSTGWMAFGFAVVKIIELGNDSNRDDITWATVWLFVWNAFEINIIIIAACIPTLIPIFEIIIGKRSISQFGRVHQKPAYTPYSSFHLRKRFGGHNKYMKSGDTESADGVDTLILENTLKSATGTVSLTTAEAGLPASNDPFDYDALRTEQENGKNISVIKQWSVR